MIDWAHEARRIRSAYAQIPQTHRARWAALHPAERRHRVRQYEALLELLAQTGWSDLAGKRVLDVGCAEGRLLGLMLDLGALPQHLAGVEVRPEVLQKAQERFLGSDLRLVEGPPWPFAEVSFDLILLSLVFSSVASQEARAELAREVLRLLRPGGYLWWWDMPHQSLIAGGHGRPLNPLRLWPDLKPQALYWGAPRWRSPIWTGRRMIRLLEGAWNVWFRWVPWVGVLLGPKP
ncbi:MAG: class I SAM-dependent methyltransferase [Bacteroidetes bacterium]|nr:class I SAM-dependent methyltransferase [Bacteroidota bacterium]